MVIDALKPLLESGLVNEETREAINEAWQNKIKELQSSLRTEIREEFANRYEHDRTVMVKTLDKMVAETLTNEVKKIKEERNEVAKIKIKTVKEMKEAAKKFNSFATRALAEELAEFAGERKVSKEHAAKLERFVMSNLAEEITEFSQDKQALTETRVKLITEAKSRLAELKAKFVARSSNAVSKIVAETLNHEISQLHEDIKVARQNNFGRKIFEAFATEFTGTHLNESSEVRKLRDQITAINSQLVEAKKIALTKSKLVESKERELKRVENHSQRDKVLSELLGPLDKNKKAVMSQLLEGVQNNQLRSAYDKYLPSVLDSRAGTVITGKTILSETAGNKNVKIVPMDEGSLSDIRRLAGLQQ